MLRPEDVYPPSNKTRRTQHVRFDPKEHTELCPVCCLGTTHRKAVRPMWRV